MHVENGNEGHGTGEFIRDLNCRRFAHLRFHECTGTISMMMGHVTTALTDDK